MKHLLPLVAIAALSLVSCSPKNPPTNKYSVAGIFYIHRNDSVILDFQFKRKFQGKTRVIFNKYSSKYDSETNRYEADEHLAYYEDLIYSQENQNVTIYNFPYYEGGIQKDSDLHIISYGDYIIHAGLKYDYAGEEVLSADQ